MMIHTEIRTSHSIDVEWLSPGESMIPRKCTQFLTTFGLRGGLGDAYSILAKETQVSRTWVPVSLSVKLASNKDGTALRDFLKISL